MKSSHSVTLGLLLTVALALAGPAGRASGQAPPPPPNSEPSTAVDHYLGVAMAAQSLQPAPLAEDAVLLRRTSLDLLGRPPSPQELAAYLADESPEKRRRMVQRLMESDEYVEHQASAYGELLMKPGDSSLREYLRTALAENRPWDAIFQELVLSERPEAAPFLKSRVKDIDKLTNEVSVVFFGLNISCAKCHTHPFVTDWTQDRFYGMKSFFSRTFEHGDMVGESDYGVVEFKTPAGESRTAELMFFTGSVIDEPEAETPDGKAKKAIKAKLEELKKKKLPAPAPSFSRRAALVEVALEAENQTHLARSIVNRLWQRHLGTGLVDPIDQMHPENPPVHPELLQWLADDLIRHDFDLRRLTKAIVLSDAYGRSSRWDSEERRPSRHLFAVAELRPLTPRQYAMTLQMGAASPSSFDADPSGHAQRIQQLRRSADGLSRKFDPVVGDFQVSVTEALLMSNNPQLADQLLQDSQDSLIGHLQTLGSAAEQADAAVRQALGRPGDAATVAAVEKHLTSGQEDARAERLRQAVWSLLCSSACRFNY